MVKHLFCILEISGFWYRRKPYTLNEVCPNFRRCFHLMAVTAPSNGSQLDVKRMVGETSWNTVIGKADKEMIRLTLNCILG
jgi:hypothetical protein